MAKKKTAVKKAAAKKATAKAPKGAAKKNGKTMPRAAKPATKPTAKAKGKSAKKATAAKKAAPKKAVAKKAVRKTAGKSVAKSTARKSTTPKTTAKTSAKSGAKIISMDQARKAQPAQKSVSLGSVFSPLDDRILIQRAGVADRTPGGLYIPETVADRPNQGKVVAVGRGHRDKKGRIKPLDVQLGDTVMYAPYSGSEISVNGVDVIVLRESDVLAILKT